jgi:hypothetical protein
MSKAIPVKVARGIAIESDLTHVVVIGFDERENMFQAATFGLRDKRDKENAAAMGEYLMSIVGADLAQGKSFEDFRPSNSISKDELIHKLAQAVMSHPYRHLVYEGLRKEYQDAQLQATLELKLRTAYEAGYAAGVAQEATDAVVAGP